jgi:hypothetical protein
MVGALVRCPGSVAGMPVGALISWLIGTICGARENFHDCSTTHGVAFCETPSVTWRAFESFLLPGAFVEVSAPWAHVLRHMF